jgi:diguanylate cyclase (GGDEF)-like protein
MAKAKENLTLTRILETVFESTPEYFVVLDLDLRIRDAGATFREATGTDGKDSVSFLDTVEQFSLSRVRTVFEELRSGGGDPHVLDINHRLPDGDTVSVAYSWLAVPGDTGETAAFVGLGRETDEIESSIEGAAAEVEELRKELDAVKDKMERRIKEITRLREEMEQRASRDDMTGLGNRRFLLERLDLEASRAIRYDEPLTLILVDIDRMIHVNETYGVEKGDEVLQKVSEVVAEQIRTSDLAGRYDGEEFLILCPHTDRPNAQFLAERLRCRVAELSFDGIEDGAETEFGITVSLGLVTVTGQNEFDVEAILHAAEQALESAKSGGMNRVRVLEVI